MYYTREPIILSVLSAKEGYNLVLKSTKISNEEPYAVASVSIVNFSGAIFYRSLFDRDFLLPVSDYIVVEEKQVKLNVKLATKKNDEIKQPKRASKNKSTKESRQQKPKKQKNIESESKETEQLTDHEKKSKKDTSLVSAKEVSEKKATKPVILPPPTNLVEVKKNSDDEVGKDASSENRTHTS